MGELFNYFYPLSTIPGDCAWTWEILGQSHSLSLYGAMVWEKYSATARLPRNPTGICARKSGIDVANEEKKGEEVGKNLLANKPHLNRDTTRQKKQSWYLTTTNTRHFTWLTPFLCPFPMRSTVLCLCWQLMFISFRIFPSSKRIKFKFLLPAAGSGNFSLLRSVLHSKRLNLFLLASLRRSSYRQHTGSLAVGRLMKLSELTSRTASDKHFAQNFASTVVCVLFVFWDNLCRFFPRP